MIMTSRSEKSPLLELGSHSVLKRACNFCLSVRGTTMAGRIKKKKERHIIRKGPRVYIYIHTHSSRAQQALAFLNRRGNGGRCDRSWFRASWAAAGPTAHRTKQRHFWAPRRLLMRAKGQVRRRRPPRIHSQLYSAPYNRAVSKAAGASLTPTQKNWISGRRSWLDFIPLSLFFCVCAWWVWHAPRVDPFRSQQTLEEGTRRRFYPQHVSLFVVEDATHDTFLCFLGFLTFGWSQKKTLTYTYEILFYIQGMVHE